ncbi:MAG TPA: hypothetical protein VGE51_04515 [Fontimonas sp.]
MTDVDRYVAAVKEHLPRKQADDLAAEIRSTLLEEIDARAQDAGRPLNAGERLEILRQHGHPMRVGAGYHARRTLIDESAFPLYKLALKYVLLGLLIAQLTQSAASVSAGHSNPVQLFFQLYWGVANSALIGFAATTLLFWVFQDKLLQLAGLDNWNPKHLAPLTEKDGRIGRGSTAFEFVFNLVVLRWLNLDWLAPDSLAALGIAAWSDEATLMLRIVSLCTVAALLLNVVDLFQPYRTRAKLWIGAAASAISALALGVIYSLGEQMLTPAPTSALWGHASDWAAKGFGCISLVLLIDAGYQIWRALQLRDRG